MKKSIWLVGASLTLVSAAAFAQSGEISVPGYGSAKGSAGTTLKNSHINVLNNRSRDVTVGGGEVGAGGFSASMTSVANVNSVNAVGSKLEGSTITVKDNESRGVTSFGGVANVNSVNLQ